ncbi:MAG: DUF6064 family protein [Chloroflexota bacterium]|nr:DUF6064 family protein [Chloroflexota bacterium]
MPFTIEMLLDYFATYNQTIWPMQAVGYALGLLTLVPLVRPGKLANRVVTGVLAFLWLWIGLMFWRPAAANMAMLYGPAVLFTVQGALFAVALARDRIAYGSAGPVYTAVGVLFIAYALIAYPVIGLLIGHVYPRAALSPLFPCPGIIVTFGALLLGRRVPWYLLIIPTLWALTGALWFSLGMVEDAGLVTAGVVGAIMIILRQRTLAPEAVAGTQS